MIYVPEHLKSLPSGSIKEGRSGRIVSLMDIYPTLVELCNLSSPGKLDGNSLLPLLVNPQSQWDYPAISTHDPFEFSIRTQNYRYIIYLDESEELYDHTVDPEEWFNLANNPEYENILNKMRELIPKYPAPFVHTSYAISQHHVPPFATKEEYLRYRETGERDLSNWKKAY